MDEPPNTPPQLTEQACETEPPLDGAALARGSATQKALRDLQKMLRSGVVPPGAPLPPQRRLARDLGVSRATLREALSILNTLGIVRIEHGRGTFVAGAEGEVGAAGEPNRRWRFADCFSLEEVYEFRLIIEPQAAALAAQRISLEGLKALEENMATFERAIREHDLVATSQCDYEFHRLILHHSGNRLLAGLDANYREALLESQRLPLQRRDRLAEPLEEHRRVVQALRACDGELAFAFMRLHLRCAAERASAKIDARGLAGPAPFRANSAPTTLLPVLSPLEAAPLEDDQTCEYHSKSQEAPGVHRLLRQVEETHLVDHRGADRLAENEAGHKGGGADQRDDKDAARNEDRSGQPAEREPPRQRG